MHYDLFDLAPYLRAGENVIAVHVKYYGRARSFWMPAVPTMSLGKTGVMVFEANLGADNWLVSDVTWQAIRCDAWDQPPPGGGPAGGGVPIEILDARRLPHGWEQPGFDDSTWGAAVVIPSIYFGGFAHSQPPTSPYGSLYPRSIAKLGGDVAPPMAIQVEHLAAGSDLTVDHPGMRLHNSLQAKVIRSEQPADLPITFEVPTDGAVRVVLDEVGECWGWGTHVHGWSYTPTKDMIFYRLGVTPAELGYTVARIAPRLGRLAWAEGKVPTPHGLIHVRAQAGRVLVDSPVPMIVDLPGQASRWLEAGHHEIKT